MAEDKQPPEQADEQTGKEAAAEPTTFDQPIVIKRIKQGGHGHHGGAWKVAYADFVTAMMAFFLLMWLLNTTTPEERKGISDFFQYESAIQGPGGGSDNIIDLGGGELMLRENDAYYAQPDVVAQTRDAESEPAEQLSEEDLQAREKVYLSQLMQDLKQQIENSQLLEDYKNQLLLDITSEGLEIQIVDDQNRPMFDLSGNELKPYTQEILQELGQTLKDENHYIGISGHTDATPFNQNRKGYSNWELSADRANAARRALLAGGMDEDQIGRVVGLASSVLFDKQAPTSPVNRRISIVVMNRQSEKTQGLPSRDH